MKPTVSVIVPIYNDPIGAELIIQSLKSQDYPNNCYEVLIIDNGSTDSTIKIIRNNIKNLNNFSLISENKIRGSYAARNRGAILSDAKILALTDSDCIPHDNWITEGVKELQRTSKYYGGGKVRFTFQKQRPNIHELFDSVHRLNQEYYVKYLYFAAAANFFIYRNIFIKVGMFNENLISSGDNEFGQRLKNSGEEITYIPDAIVQHPARNTYKSNMIKNIRLANGLKQLNNSNSKKTLKHREENKLYNNLSMFELAKIIIFNLKQYFVLIIRRITNQI